MYKIEEDIIKKLLLYPKRKIKSGLKIQQVKKKLNEEVIVVGISKTERNLYNTNTYLFCIRYYFRLPNIPDFTIDDCTQFLLKETRQNGLLQNIDKVSASLENFLPAKHYDETGLALQNGIFALERTYLTRADAFYNFHLQGNLHGRAQNSTKTI